MGIAINHSKSHVINIEEGVLAPKYLTLLSTAIIPPVTNKDCIRYLGVNFKDKIVIEHKQFLINLEKDFRNLISPLFRGNQKINILN